MIAYLICALAIAIAIAVTMAYMAPMQTKVVHITGVQVKLPQSAKTAADAKITAKAVLQATDTYIFSDLLAKIRIMQDWLDHCKDVSYFLTLSQGATLNVGEVALSALEFPVKIVLTLVDNMKIRIYIVPEADNAGKLHATGTNIKYNTGNTGSAGYIECKKPATALRINNAQVSFGRGVPKVF